MKSGKSTTFALGCFWLEEQRAPIPKEKTMFPQLHYFHHFCMLANEQGVGVHEDALPCNWEMFLVMAASTMKGTIRGTCCT